MRISYYKWLRGCEANNVLPRLPAHVLNDEVVETGKLHYVKVRYRENIMALSKKKWWVKITISS